MIDYGAESAICHYSHDAYDIALVWIYDLQTIWTI